MTVVKVSQPYLFNRTYMRHATNCMTKCIYPNTVSEIWNKSFSVLAWHGLY